MTIESDEQILRRERIHPAVFILFLVPVLAMVAVSFSGLLLITSLGRAFGINPGLAPLLWLLPAAAAGAVGFVVPLMACLNCEVTLTSRRLMYRTGAIIRRSGEFPLENVEGILLFEPLLGRVFGYGTVTVTTLGGVQCPLGFIPRPQVLHALLQKAVAAAKARSQTSKLSAALATGRFSPGVDNLAAGWSGPKENGTVPVLAIWTGLACLAILALSAAFFYWSASRAPAAVARLVPPAPAVLAPTVSVPFALPAPFVQPSQPSIAEIKAAAEGGNPEAENELGDLYRSDPEKAAFWYRKAASQGNAHSQYQLGHLLMFWASNPVASKETRAMYSDEGVAWLIKAANGGVKLAQVELGLIYRDGQYLAKDLPEAYKWCCLASDGSAVDYGANLGKTYRDQLVLKMSQDQIAEGNRRVAAFAPNSGDDVPVPEPTYVAQIKLQGVGGAPPRRFAMINNQTLAVSETATLKLDGRSVTVRCLAITDASATIAIEGLPGSRELRLR